MIQIVYPFIIIYHLSSPETSPDETSPDIIIIIIYHVSSFNHY